ncbi:hypothetical protein B0H17DRAFT_1141815 [Mycena rosella]|uniref:DUF6534 domain-containing protein n=1 Tax=Mycena rosella TaxID=1033263 RepID=A0AAD7D2I2_MYCRO|nr:hypothetical protein B0H17DRAFT_1141815 [Mycena rosella]
MYDVVVISAAGNRAYQKYYHKDPTAYKVLRPASVPLGNPRIRGSPYTVYEYLVTGHLDKLAFTRTWALEVFPATFIAFMVRNFYAYRIYRLSNGNWLLGGSVVSPGLSPTFWLNLNISQSLLSLGACVILTLELWAEPLGTGNVKGFDGTVQSGAGVDSVVDILDISLATVAGPQNLALASDITGALVDSLISGLPTTVCSVLAAITVAASHDIFIYIFFFLLLYTNSLLMTLNARDYIRAKSNDDGIQIHSGIRFRPGPDRISPTRADSMNNQITIHIDKRIEIDTDLEESHRCSSTEGSDSKPRI